ncbi:hypothetical protein ATM97_22230 [Nocardia sp. MH4]|nr:hypothetical protein [Nocardia sp. MH4]
MSGQIPDATAMPVWMAAMAAMRPMPMPAHRGVPRHPVANVSRNVPGRRASHRMIAARSGVSCRIGTIRLLRSVETSRKTIGTDRV